MLNNEQILFFKDYFSSRLDWKASFNKDFKEFESGSDLHFFMDMHEVKNSIINKLINKLFVKVNFDYQGTTKAGEILYFRNCFYINPFKINKFKELNNGSIEIEFYNYRAKDTLDDFVQILSVGSEESVFIITTDYSFNALSSEITRKKKLFNDYIKNTEVKND